MLFLVQMSQLQGDGCYSLVLLIHFFLQQLLAHGQCKAAKFGFISSVLITGHVLEWKNYL